MGEPHPINKNTDFISTMETRQPFFCNDLPALYWKREYENSNWAQDRVRRGDIDYVAAMVLPVVVRPIKKGDPPARAIAFLCIDSQKKNSFSKRHDVALAASYARAVYPLLRFLLSDNDGAPA